MLSEFIATFKDFLHSFAELSIGILELIGIIIIIVGSCRALVRLLYRVIKKQPVYAIMGLGKVFLLALEFKMGAEIIKTVIVHNFEELAILVIVILIRTLLAFVVHWEIRTGRRSHSLQKAESKDEAEKETEEA